jgi:hypothetical protein
VDLTRNVQIMRVPVEGGNSEIVLGTSGSEFSSGSVGFGLSRDNKRVVFLALTTNQKTPQRKIVIAELDQGPPGKTRLLDPDPRVAALHKLAPIYTGWQCRRLSHTRKRSGQCLAPAPRRFARSPDYQLQIRLD